MIRNILRNWLGIQDCKEPECVDLSAYVRRKDIVKLVSSEIIEAFKDEPDLRYIPLFSSLNFSNARGLIDNKVKEILNGDQEKEIKSKVSEIISSESLIEDVVSRINKNQLDTKGK